ncbi:MULTISPECIES: fimbrial protein [Providencia]|uniref:fimbrial protein n=1 Tax=Providencia TaxID=586 RepID=UPI000F79F47C|nr:MULTISPECIES: type 1 fimbrial protein [Providencia]MBV2190425.1 type 1 fimbrial protein [Providencia rettgeri]UPS61507.1 type 1 fimbrial protein [Providencia rettgeri]
MRNLTFLVPTALILLSTSALSNAASNAQMTITANVVAATCDVSVSAANLDLGNFAQSQFATQAVATPLSASVKNFTIGLSGCENPKAIGDTANVVVSGQTLGGNTNMFNSTGTDSGIMLSLAGSPTTYITNQEKIEIADASTTNANEFNGKTLAFQAGLAATSTTPQIGVVNAPILFSFAYN